MIAAFGSALDDAVLRPRLRKEGSLDAYDELRSLADSSAPVQEETLQELLERLHHPGRILRTDEE